MRKSIIILAIIAALTGWTAHRIDIDFGRVLNEQGDGKVYNGEAYYNYIAYPEEYHTDDIILTFCVLNPLNTYNDDIIYRADFRLLENVL